MTLLAVGTCLVIAAAAQTQWTAPRWLRPLLTYGRRSYEVYLTHMFVVFAGFRLFLKMGGTVRTGAGAVRRGDWRGWGAGRGGGEVLLGAGEPLAAGAVWKRRRGVAAERDVSIMTVTRL